MSFASAAVPTRAPDVDFAVTIQDSIDRFLMYGAAVKTYGRTHYLEQDILKVRWSNYG